MRHGAGWRFSWLLRCRGKTALPTPPPQIKVSHLSPDPPVALSSQCSRQGVRRAGGGYRGAFGFRQWIALQAGIAAAAVTPVAILSATKEKGGGGPGFSGSFFSSLNCQVVCGIRAGERTPYCRSSQSFFARHARTFELGSLMMQRDALSMTVLRSCATASSISVFLKSCDRCTDLNDPATNQCIRCSFPPPQV